MKSSEKEAYRLLGVFIAGVIALDIHGIFTYYVIGYTPTSNIVSGNRRLETLTGGANPASCLNALMIVVVLWLRLNGKLTFKSSAMLVSIMLVTMVLTSSNSGIIAMSAGILVFLGSDRWRRSCRSWPFPSCFLWPAVRTIFHRPFRSGFSIQWLQETSPKRAPSNRAAR
jgi:hypothetical protein